MQKALIGILGILVLFLAASGVRLRQRVLLLENELASGKRSAPSPAKRSAAGQDATAEAPTPPRPSPAWNLLDSKDPRLERPGSIQDTAPKKPPLGAPLSMDGATAWTASPQGTDPELQALAGRRPGFLGIQGEDVPGGGVKINGIVPDSVAGVAGLQPQDVIVEVNGEPIDSLASLTTRIRGAGEGAPASLRIRRNGVEFYQGVQLGANAPR